MSSSKKNVVQIPEKNISKDIVNYPKEKPLQLSRSISMMPQHTVKQLEIFPKQSNIARKRNQESLDLGKEESDLETTSDDEETWMTDSQSSSSTDSGSMWSTTSESDPCSPDTTHGSEVYSTQDLAAWMRQQQQVGCASMNHCCMKNHTPEKSTGSGPMKEPEENQHSQDSLH